MNSKPEKKDEIVRCPTCGIKIGSADGITEAYNDGLFDGQKSEREEWEKKIKEEIQLIKLQKEAWRWNEKLLAYCFDGGYILKELENLLKKEGEK